MAFEIFKLMGSIMVDSSKAEDSIQKTDQKAGSLGQTLAGGLKTAGKWAAGLTAGAVAVGGAMIAAAKDQASAADVVDKASIRMGISAQSYQELAHAASLSGVEMSTLEKAAKKLEGTDINFDEAIEQIMSIGDESERTQAAIDLFGESVAYQMTPLLAAGSEGLAEMRQEANELGLVMSDDMVADGAAMNDAFYKVEASLGSLKTGIMAELMPVLMQMLDWVVQKMPEIRATVQGVVGAIKPLIENMIPLIESIFTIAGWLWDNTLKPVLNGIITFLTGVFTGDWSKAWSGVKEIFSGLISALQGLWEYTLKPVFQAIDDFLSNNLGPVFSTVWGTVNTVVQTAFSAIGDLWNNSLKPIFTGIVDFVRDVFSGDFSGAFSALVDIIKGIWGGIVTIIKYPINQVINLINGFINGLNKIKVPSWVPGVGGMGINIPNIPQLAEGGILERGQTGFLEGNGAEAVVPLDQNRKWISAVAQDMRREGIGSSDRTEALLAGILDMLETIARSGITMDGQRVADIITPRIDRNLGHLAVSKGR